VSDEPDFVVIGLLRRAHGTRGELAVQVETDVPERFSRAGVVLLRHNGTIRSVGIEAVRGAGKTLLVKLEGIDTRDGARALVGAELGVRRQDVRPLPEGTYYVFDLVGCSVVRETGQEIGVVEDVWKMPANDVFAVRCGSREILIPAVKSVVRRVDLDAGIVYIAEMEGLLD
jgi:16S rRNA processing protein RimM